MKKNFQNTDFFLSLLIGLFSTPPAIAQQKSDYLPLVRQGYSGYKDVYNPNAGFLNILKIMINKIYPGCVSAIFIFGANLAVAQNSKSDYQNYVDHLGGTSNFKLRQTPESLPYLTWAQGIKTIFYQIVPRSNQNKLKFFLPPGTVGIEAGAYFFTANQEGKAVIKLKEPPETPFSNINALNVFTPENLGGAQGNAYDETILRNLIDRKEVLYFSEGNTANYMLLSSPNSLINPMTTGDYVYANFQPPGGRLQRIEWKVHVKADCYEQWFNSSTTQWVNGNPDENATHICAGSTGGGSSGDGSQVAAAEISGKSETVDTNGNLIINFKLKRPASETQNTNRTSFWIAAYVPAGLLPEDAWFFLTPNGWQQLASTNPYTVAYQNSQAAQPEKIFNISTGLSAADLRHFNAQLHFGYMGNDGQLKDMGMIWSGN